MATVTEDPGSNPLIGNSFFILNGLKRHKGSKTSNWLTNALLPVAYLPFYNQIHLTGWEEMNWTFC